jgi:hypothetical protein
MISTVTTTTVTTIVTLTTTGASLGVLATILLFSLLGTQEATAENKRPSLKVLRRYLNVGILPLLIVFLLIVCLKVTEVV